jgi:hypothetical protein
MVIRHTRCGTTWGCPPGEAPRAGGTHPSELRVEIEEFYRRGTMSDALVGLRNGVQTALQIHRAAADNHVSRGCHYREEG